MNAPINIADMEGQVNYRRLRKLMCFSCHKGYYKTHIVGIHMSVRDAFIHI